MDEHMENEWFQVEQGMESPRDGSIGFRHWEYFPDKQRAVKAARKLGIARVLQVKVIARIGHEAVADADLADNDLSS